MNTSNNKDSFYAAALFLIWPFLATISAFRNYRAPWAKNIFWAFCAFYGLAFAIGAESQGSDIVRYVAEYQSLHKVDMTLASAKDYYDNSGEIDILRTVIAVTLSRLTDNQAALTFIYAIIFGFFFSRNIWYILDRLKGKLLPVTILLLVCFFLVNPIWRINGFRMWTAAHIFIFGLLPYLCEGKKNGLWISAASILVHFSFLVPVGVLFMYVFLGNRLTLYYGFFIATFFISEIDIDAFNNLIETYMPDILQERSSSYRSENKVELHREAESEGQWYANWYRTGLNWGLMGFLSLFYFKGRDLFDKNIGWMNLFCFSLFFYGVANLFSTLPSGQRYLVIAFLMVLPLVIFFVQNQLQDKLLKWYIILVSPALFLFIVVAVRIGLYSMSVTSIMGNPILAFFFTEQNISLNDLMRMIL
jgi:hypothetical protein